jgi:cholesterol transport system auxiliary component
MHRLLALLLCVCPACALMSKAQPLAPRYFSPDEGSAPRAPAPGTAPLELRLGEVEAAVHLEQRIAYRPSDGELGYYESWRWTEPPQAYLRRALERELFERRGLVRVVSGSAPTLNVELTSFEELRAEPARARVELSIVLRGERRALLEHTLRKELPLPAGSSDEPLRLTRTLSQALDSAVSEVADLVSARLAEDGR